MIRLRVGVKIKLMTTTTTTTMMMMIMMMMVMVVGVVVMVVMMMMMMKMMMMVVMMVVMVMVAVMVMIILQSYCPFKRSCHTWLTSVRFPRWTTSRSHCLWYVAQLVFEVINWSLFTSFCRRPRALRTWAVCTLDGRRTFEFIKRVMLAIFRVTFKSTKTYLGQRTPNNNDPALLRMTLKCTETINNLLWL